MRAFYYLQVPYKGALALVMTLALLQGLIGMALGVIVASVWKAELTVLHFALMSAIYPNILLSG